MNEDYELFVYDGPKTKFNHRLCPKTIDKKLPPAATLERGPDSIRTYWNGKAKREGERRKTDG